MSIRIVKVIFQSYVPYQGRFPRVSGQARILADAGHEVTILACDRTGEAPASEEVGGAHVERLTVKTGEMLGPLRQLWPLAVFYFKAFRWLRKQPFDMLHCHNLDVLPLGWLVRWTRRVKVVFEAHEPNYYALWPRRLRFMVRVMEAVDRFLARRVDAVSVTNPFQVRKYRAAGVREVRLIGNYPPPELRASAPRRRTAAGEPITFGRLGTFYPRVGVEETLEAFRRAADGSPGARLLLGGRVVDSYRDRFAAAVGPLQGSVIVLGRYRAERMRELYRRIDVSCLIYPQTEWFRNITPRKFFDSLANGVPVIMTDIGELGQVITARGCGLVVDERDIDGMADAMRRLVEDRRLLHEMSQAAFALAESDYSWGRLVEDYLDFIGDVHDPSHAPTAVPGRRTAPTGWEASP